MTQPKHFLDGGAGEARVPLLDSSSHSQLVMDSPHHMGHDGVKYKLSAQSSDLSTTPVHLSFTTPNTAVRFHMLANAAARNGEATFTITEAPTGGVTGGSTATPVNRRRESSNVSSGTNFLTGATAPTGGTAIDAETFGATGVSEVVGGQGGNARDEDEWVLAPNTIYSFRLTSAAAIGGEIRLNWYEHADKN